MERAFFALCEADFLNEGGVTFGNTVLERAFFALCEADFLNEGGVTFGKTRFWRRKSLAGGRLENSN
ncbi:hypothetical protein [Chitinophaga tropicalis]|uniref:Uncharacterized protein n=1 Tax=Chitinophaga tropicalis TaxID=2683588 RepID=A0A7K1UAX4_9BACT|nr:hypothetical protein [Chitinophaga tropicalis]MVT11524.1 hypothetical protein [Chitinophaga tropicalis]